MVMVFIDSKKTLTLTNPDSLYLNGDDSGMCSVGGCIQHTQITLILLCILLYVFVWIFVFLKDCLTWSRLTLNSLYCEIVRLNS